MCRGTLDATFWTKKGRVPMCPAQYDLRTRSSIQKVTTRMALIKTVQSKDGIQQGRTKKVPVDEGPYSIEEHVP